VLTYNFNIIIRIQAIRDAFIKKKEYLRYIKGAGGLGYWLVSVGTRLLHEAPVLVTVLVLVPGCYMKPEYLLQC